MTVTDQTMYVTMALSGFASVGVVTGATLAGWRGWLQLRRAEIERRQDDAMPFGGAAPSAGARIEIADLKERIRKLEAIAAGVDL